MKKRLIAALLCGCFLATPALAASSFPTVNTYSPGYYTDVKADEWYAAAVEGTRDMPQPDWAKEEPKEAPQAQFPFLKPNFNIVGMFLSDMAACDNLTQYRGYITMR